MAVEAWKRKLMLKQIKTEFDRLRFKAAKRTPEVRARVDELLQEMLELTGKEDNTL